MNFNDAPNIKLYWEKYVFFILFIIFKFNLPCSNNFFRDYDSSDKNKNKMYSFQDVKNLFLSHHFVDEKLIPKRWIEHHFHMIYRKLVTTEFSFPNYFKNK